MPELTDILLYIAIGVGALCLLLLIILIARPAKGGDGTALKRIEDKTEEALKYADYSARAADNLSRNTEMRLNNIESRLAEDIKYIADVNAHNLEVIRRTVDDKLTSSDGKLSESYARISDRLEKMHKSVGEMQALSESVSDIRRVFTNVKLRGTWGETQLNALLEQMLAPDQYERSCKLDPLGNTLVDFAIRLPSVSGDTLLPVDSKFPVEEYERLALCKIRSDVLFIYVRLAHVRNGNHNDVRRLHRIGGGENLEALLSCFKPETRSFKKGETILVYSSSLKYLCVLTSGRAHLYCMDSEGEYALLEQYGPNDIFGEVFAMPYGDLGYAVEADSDCRVMFIPFDFPYSLA